MISTLSRSLTNRLLILTFTLFELVIREVASCSFYNVNIGTFEHWNCPRHTVCCIYYSEKSCCREQEAYMNSGYTTGGSAGGKVEGDDWDKILYFFRDHYTQVMVVLSGLLIFILAVLCCLQWKRRMEEEEEEEELFRINQMIQMSEGGARSPTSSLYRPQPLCPLHHGEEPPSELTTITAQQPPSYDSVTKGTNSNPGNPGPSQSSAHDNTPPPPYAP